MKLTNEQIAAMMIDAILNGKESKIKKDEPAKSVRECSAELGKSLYESMLGFKDAGFDDRQAFQLMLTSFSKCGGDC